MRTPRRIRMELPERIPGLDPWQMDALDSYSRAISGINFGLLNHLESIVPSLLSTIQLSFTSHLLGIQRVFDSALTSILRPFPELTNPKVRVAEELGWVVHHTLPISLLNETSEEDLGHSDSHFLQRRVAGCSKGIRNRHTRLPDKRGLERNDETGPSRSRGRPISLGPPCHAPGNRSRSTRPNE